MTRRPRRTKAKSPLAATSRREVKGPAAPAPTAADRREVVNAVVVDGALDPQTLLSRALDGAGLWDDLAAAAKAAQVAPAALRIVIKPQLDAFAPTSPAATDPALVEALVDLLHDAGFSNVALVAARDSSALWAENRDVIVLGDLLGYRFSTAKGRPYDIVDLGEDLVRGAFSEGESLHGSSLARTWVEADYRIVFAKNRTDERNAFALCLDGLLGVLPLEDKDYHYRHRREPGDVAVELLRATPVQFAVIDAIVSAHGSAGSRAPMPVATGTLIASRNILLCDYAGAAKMGMDPHASPINARALRAIGLPAAFGIDGNLAPYASWQNVHPLIVDSTRSRDAWVEVSRTVQPWLQSLDRDLFPLKNPVDDRLNRTLAEYFTDPDADPLAFWALVYANYWLGGLHRGFEAYRTLFDKDALRRRETPLGVDPEQFAAADYENIAAELLPIADLVAALAPDANGLRWRYLDKAIAFEFARTIPVPFDHFVAKIDVTRTIQLMNDYIGGVAVPVARDAAGRVTRQAERNLYLPQPNYLVLYQGDVIDVTKLEYATYRDGEHRMFWKTIKSENGSARFDDGIVTFAREGEDTRVSICGRQLFTLPPFWQAVDLDLAPALKSALVRDAYTVFFRRTMANFEAVIEGRDIRIGQPWHDPATAPGTEPLVVERVAAALTQLKERFGNDGLRDLQSLLSFKRGQPASLMVDADGFRHFGPPAAADEPGATARDGGLALSLIKAGAGELFRVWKDVADALRKDVGREVGGQTSSGP